MSLNHMKKRNVAFRKTLLGIVKDIHERFLIGLGVDVSNMKTLKRWHPQFRLEECEVIKPGKFINASAGSNFFQPKFHKNQAPRIVR